MLRRPSLLIAFFLAASLLVDAAPPAAAQEQLREIPLSALPADEQPSSQPALAALALEPEKWRHAQTASYNIHFRRQTEARKVAREIEDYLATVVNFLGFKPEDIRRRSNAFVFEDEDEWARFIRTTDVPMWTAAFAHGDELFLNVRRQSGPQRFDSRTLAHETTHAVVFRLYGADRWPLWLSEGFAEYMGGAAVAARKNQPVSRHQEPLPLAIMPLAEMVTLTDYPAEPLAVASLYQSSERLVRFLIATHGPVPFRLLARSLMDNVPFSEALPAAYPQYPDLPALEAAYRKFPADR